uniref:Ornithine carbamoyltransferase n=1 Tax=uncultured Actinomycetes bacterium TaxID=152507 RepID=D0U5X5_9ACTN|nr:ornithine carbamoyltransferase [uncultured Actinomycetes bacterium]
MTNRDFLQITDLDASDLEAILQLAIRPIASLGRPLEGKGVALIFEKPSNRTRHSMEMAVVQLGGHPVYTRGEEVGLDVRESVEDISHVMSGYHAMLCARVFDHHVLDRMSASSSVPVVNMLSDVAHPLQAVADVLTMQQHLSTLAGKTVAYVGDFNNVARSLCHASAMLGMHIRIGCPAGYSADESDLDQFRELGAASVNQYDTLDAAVKGAHAVHTDTWTSMGQESESKVREAAFVGFEVTEQAMALAAPGAVFLHCLPAHRGQEVSEQVIDGPNSLIYPQAHNRMHAARAVLAFLLGVRP